MGIQGLWALLNDKFPEVFSDVDDSLDIFTGQTFGIDTSIYMHRVGDEPIEAFLHQAHELIARNIRPVYVFDGQRHAVKKHEHERRRDQYAKVAQNVEKRADFLAELKTLDTVNAAQVHRIAETVGTTGITRTLNKKPADLSDMAGFAQTTVKPNIMVRVAQMEMKHMKDTEEKEDTHKYSDDTYRALMDAFTENNIGYYIATGDAEKLGAQLVKQNIIDVFVTDDGDALAFGATRVLRNLFSSKGMKLVSLPKVLESLGNFTQEQFVDMCLICGCDYLESRGIPSLGPIKALGIIKKYVSLPLYLDSLEWQGKLAWIKNSAKYSTFNMEEFNHDLAREMFLDTKCQIAYASMCMDSEAGAMPERVRDLSEVPIKVSVVQENEGVFINGEEYECPPLKKVCTEEIF